MQTAPNWFVILNVLGFQAVWLAWAWGAPLGQALWPALGSVLFLVLHFAVAPNKRRDAWALLLCVGVGAVFDTAMMQSGMIDFALPNPAPLDPVEPFWMLLLWACLGCTLHTGLAWLQRWPRGTYPISAVFGWLSYEAAHRLGALSLADNALCMASLLLFWGVFIPWAQTISASLAQKAATDSSTEA